MFTFAFGFIGVLAYIRLKVETDEKDNPIYKKIGIAILVICLCGGFVTDCFAPKEVEHSREYYEQREKKAKDFYDFYDAYEKAKSNY